MTMCQLDQMEVRRVSTPMISNLYNSLTVENVKKQGTPL